MGIRKYYFLILLLVPILISVSVNDVFALEQACPDCEAEGAITSEEELLQKVPISVWTDKSLYNHESTIRVDGQVANIRAGTPVTLTVISPTNNIVTQDQLTVDGDGNYGITLSTAGNLWKYDGIYTIRVQYGGEAVNNKVLVELTSEETTSTETHSNCGKGTIFDPKTNSCILEPILEPESRLPSWVKNIFIWYGQDLISEDEIINALQFLIRQGTIIV